MLYDELIFQDGRFLCAIEAEHVFEGIYPPGMIPGDRSKIRYFQPGLSFTVQVSRTRDGPYHPLMQGPTLASYQVDFYPILEEAGLLGAAYIRAYLGDLADERKAIAKEQAHSDQSARDVLGDVPGGVFGQNQIVESLYVDSLLADGLGLTFSIDQRCMPLVAHENALIARRWRNEPRATVGDVWLSLGFPDFGALTWEEVREIRDSAAARDYRRMVGRIGYLINTALDEGVEAEEVVALGRREIVHELIEAMSRLRPSAGSLVVNLALNLVPYGGVGASTKDLTELIQYHRSWISLLSSPTGRLG